jgi:hypothetical protein
MKKQIAYTLFAVIAAFLACATMGRSITYTYDTPPVLCLEASATGAAGAQTATLPATAGRMTYIEGFDVSGGGATAASVINITVTGITNTTNHSTTILAGVTGPMNAQGVYSVRFPTPIPASANNTAIVVNVPSFGAGCTLQSVNAYGFSQ